MKSMYFLKFSKKLPIGMEKCWDFFSSPENLKFLTPAHLQFVMRKELPSQKMYPGQMIGYTIRLFGFTVEWVTEITHVQDYKYFIDEQRLGPYALWHHEHRFHEIPHGVEMVDAIYYKMPFGPLGKALHHLKVKKDLEGIFSYRSEQLDALFGTYSEPKE